MHFITNVHKDKNIQHINSIYTRSGAYELKMVIYKVQKRNRSHLCTDYLMQPFFNNQHFYLYFRLIQTKVCTDNINQQQVFQV